MIKSILLLTIILSITSIGFISNQAFAGPPVFNQQNPFLGDFNCYFPENEIEIFIDDVLLEDQFDEGIQQQLDLNKIIRFCTMVDKQKQDQVPPFYPGSTPPKIFDLDPETEPKDKQHFIVYRLCPEASEDIGCETLPELESAFQKLPEPINPLAGYPTYTTSWTNIERMEDFQVQGHSNSENYLLRFKLVSVDQKEIASDGTISISIMDKYNRILYLDAFSVKKNDFSKYRISFSNDEDLVYYWEIPTSDVKLGFGELGSAKIVFTDRARNSFSGEFNEVAIPSFS